MRDWVHYWRTVSDRITWDRSVRRGAWVVPWLHLRLRQRRPAMRSHIAYYPQPAGPWYTMPLALAGTSVRKTRDLSKADAIMFFDDQTVSNIALPDISSRPDMSVRRINAGATDISKTHVGDVFERIFGYPLTVDAQHHTGPMVQKSDRNGVHDGCIVEGPLKRVEPGCIYQRLVDSTVAVGVTEDLRCVCVAGQIIQVFRKEKDVAARFQPLYRQTTLQEPDTIFTDEERAAIQRFCADIGLDFGSIDVLRDYTDGGRLYIVDVNKTCMPVLSMPVAELEKALGRIGVAVERLLIRPDDPTSG